jgi:hypothetical protein
MAAGKTKPVGSMPLLRDPHYLTGENGERACTMCLEVASEEVAEEFYESKCIQCTGTLCNTCIVGRQCPTCRGNRVTATEALKILEYAVRKAGHDDLRVYAKAELGLEIPERGLVGKRKALERIEALKKNKADGDKDDEDEEEDDEEEDEDGEDEDEEEDE